jgi:hypothetical protein
MHRSSRLVNQRRKPPGTLRYIHGGELPSHGGANY